MILLLAYILAVNCFMTACHAFVLPASSMVALSRPVLVRNDLGGSTRIYNVPPKPLVDEDSTSALKDAADREAPPQSFFQLQKNSVRAVQSALRDGHKLLEIEFPPLPANVLEMDDVSAYDIAEANTKLAVDFAKGFLAELSTSGLPADTTDNFQITILFPDEEEEKIAVKGALGGIRKPAPGIQTGSLRRSEEGDTRVFKPEHIFLSLFGGGSGGLVKPYPNTKMYIVIVASAQELPDIEELHSLDPNAVIICYNLKLDTLRGDLGAPAFPGRDFHDRFLSKVKPVYYLRTRQYTRSVPTPPFMVNFQGCLFRSYPGKYQTLLDTGDGRAYRRIQTDDVRPALGIFKEQLTRSLQIDGIIQEEGGLLSFLRTGYKTTTWWEEERDDASDAWKT